MLGSKLGGNAVGGNAEGVAVGNDEGGAVGNDEAVAVVTDKGHGDLLTHIIPLLFQGQLIFNFFPHDSVIYTAPTVYSLLNNVLTNGSRRCNPDNPLDTIEMYQYLKHNRTITIKVI